jgi:hypothetical protein
MRRRVELVWRWRIDTCGDRGDGVADDGNGGAERDAEFYCNGEQRQRGEGRDVGGVVRNGGWMRIVVGDDQRFGNGNHVYGARGGAESGDGDVDGDVGERRNEVGFGDDHDWSGAGWCQCDDLTEGDGLGGESSAGVDGDGGERCWWSGSDLVGEQRNF